MAWLNATPKDAKQSRREEKSEGGLGSPFLLMPPVDYEYEYLLSLWHEAGTVESGANGITRLSWQEINAWANNNHSEEITEWVDIGDDAYERVTTKRILLEKWELETIRLLSEEYAAEYNSASDKDRPPPYSPEDISINNLDRNAVGSKMKNILGGFKKSSQEPKYETEERT